MGNYFAYRLSEYLHEVLKAIGLEPERIRMEFCSSAEGSKFREVAIEFDETIRKLGPNPLRPKGGTSKKK
ncbi:MAG: hydrogenase iron-sulfur subunit [Promethearchaeota archaeon]|nr:MAG: hydrogenase iron-sulfur subunit [Candidatus Lokiarchaeota archaeon]